MAFLLEFKPNFDPFQNRLEFVGELTILILAWILTSFNASNTVNSQEAASVFFVILISLILVYHFSILLLFSFRAFRRSYLRRQLIKRAKKRRQNYQKSEMFHESQLSQSSSSLATIKAEIVPVFHPPQFSAQDIESHSDCINNTVVVVQQPQRQMMGEHESFSDAIKSIFDSRGYALSALNSISVSADDYYYNNKESAKLDSVQKSSELSDQLCFPSALYLASQHASNYANDLAMYDLSERDIKLAAQIRAL